MQNRQEDMDKGRGNLEKCKSSLQLIPISICAKPILQKKIHLKIFGFEPEDVLKLSSGKWTSKNVQQI